MTVMSHREGGVMSAIARFEGRKLLTSGPFLAGVGIALFGSAIFLLAARERFASWDHDAWTMGVGFILMGILTMVATNRAGLRDRREHTVEQHASLPVSQTARRGGLLLATASPAGAAAILLAAALVGASFQLAIPDFMYVHYIHLVLLVVMFGILGAALASWFSSPFVAPLLAFALFFVNPGDSPSAWGAAWPLTIVESVSVATWHLAHLAYIASLIVIFGVCAVGRFGMRRSMTAALVTALVVGSVALGIVVTQACPDVSPCLL
jgi:hypothetical protein